MNQGQKLIDQDETLLHDTQEHEQDTRDSEEPETTPDAQQDDIMSGMEGYTDPKEVTVDEPEGVMTKHKAGV